MPFVNINQVGAIGVIRDLSTHELPMRWLKFVVVTFCLAISLIRSFGSWIKAKMNMLSIDGYASTPFVAEAMPSNTNISRFIIGLNSHVLMILSVATFAQIAYSIIGFVSVNMVNICRRKMTVCICPSKPMSKISPAKNSNCYIASIQDLFVFLANKRFLTISAPSKNSSIWTKCKSVAQFFYVNSFHFQSPLIERLRVMKRGNWHRNQRLGATLAAQGVY